MSAEKGEEGAVRALLRHGAEADGAGAKKGETPLYAAVREGHVGVAKMLLVNE